MLKLQKPPLLSSAQLSPELQWNKILFFALSLKSVFQGAQNPLISSLIVYKNARNRSQALSLTVRTLTSLSIALSFFFLLPTTSANAVFSERVIQEAPATLKVSDQIQAKKALTFTAPLHGTYISTYFSLFHPGIDIPNPKGNPIRTVADGVVTYAGWSNEGYGNLIIVKHDQGYESLYAHLSQIAVKVGEGVDQGQMIGLVGATGQATGNHLHIEIHSYGKPVNPLRFFWPL